MDHDIIEELDDLISDIHGLIDEQQPPQAEPEEPADVVLPEEPEVPVEEAPAEEDPQTQRWTDRQKVPKHVAKLQQNQQEAYAKWLQEQAEKAPEPPPEVVEEEAEAGQKTGKKKKSTALWLCIFAAVLALCVVLAACWILPRQPKAPVSGIRVSGTSTILLAGTDDTYARTDMLMLLTLSGKSDSLCLVSLPRDTVLPGQEEPLGSVYGLAGGGSEGIQALKEAVRLLVGFEPDGCIVLHPETLTAFVDTLGQVQTELSYDLPLDETTLKAGRQRLDGMQALALMSYCMDEDEADLRRMQTQRQFMTQLIDTCTTRGILKAPKLLDVLTAHTVTDLSSANFLWLARTALGVDTKNVYTATLPGHYEDGFVADAEKVVQTVNAGCNPYVRAIGVEDLGYETAEGSIE